MEAIIAGTYSLKRFLEKTPGTEKHKDTGALQKLSLEQKATFLITRDSELLIGYFQIAREIQIFNQDSETCLFLRFSKVTQC